MAVIKLRTDSSPNKVAGALAGMLLNGEDVELQGIGAGAINQGVKAIAIARGYVAPHGIDIKCIPAFTNTEVEGEDRTAIKFIIVK